MSQQQKLIDDVEFYKMQNDILVFGSMTKNEYIKVRCNNIEAIINMLKMFNGNNELETVKEYCITKKINISLDQLVDEISKKGLFSNTSVSNKKEEIEMLGVKVFLKEFGYNSHYAVPKSIYIIFAFIILTLAAAIAICIGNFSSIPQIFNKNLLKYRDSYILGMGVTLLVSTLVLIIHESGHCLFAAINKIQIYKVGLYLYLGIMPKWFINFRGIRVASKRKKLLVFAGGCFFNVYMIILASAANALWPELEIMKSVIIANLFMMLNCLIPFSLTDGYFIFSTITNIDNLRYSMFKSIKDIKRLHFTKKNLLLLGYMLINFGFWLYRLYLFYYWIFISLLEVVDFANIIIIAMIAVHLFLIIKRVTKN